MTTEPMIPKPDPSRIRAFKAACRKALKAMGITDVRFRTSKVTGMPIVVYSMSAAQEKGIDLNQMVDRVIDLSDEFDVDAGTVPAEYYQLHIG